MKNYVRKIYLYTAILVMLFALMIPSTSSAQNQNALSFDGIDDKVVVTSGSSLVAGSGQISLTCWVYPTNANPVFPDFDGFAGIRNDVNADFYMVQIAPFSTVEARFRNSAGTAFNIAYNGLQLNTWQHFAFTYDGLMTRLYKNGVEVDSTVATGVISNSAVNFTIGNVVYLTTDYLLAGKTDEVSLWSKALSAQEVNCIYNAPIHYPSSDLQLYYNFNQGIAGGNNAGQTTLTDHTGHINGNLLNFALTGATSNYVAGVINYTPVAATICQGQTYSFGTTILTASGTYTQTLTSTSGCDSAVVLTLTVTPVDTSVTKSGNTLTSNQAGATYQWLNCTTGTAISGATNQNYIVTANGSYAVIVTINGCTDTSNCHIVNTVGIYQNYISSQLSVSPNPASDKLYIKSNNLLQNVIVRITDAAGKEISIYTFSQLQNQTIDIASLTAGFYLMEINTANGKAIKRFVRELGTIYFQSIYNKTAVAF
jgi:hypothetical protein